MLFSCITAHEYKLFRGDGLPVTNLRAGCRLLRVGNESVSGIERRTVMPTVARLKGHGVACMQQNCRLEKFLFCSCLALLELFHGESDLTISLEWE